MEASKFLRNVKYSNELNILPLRTLKEIELDIFWSSVSFLKDTGQGTVIISNDEIKKLIEWNPTHSNKRYRAYLDGLMKKLASLPMRYEFPDGRIRWFPIFDNLETGGELGDNLQVELNSKFIPLFNELTKNFTKFDLENMVALSSSYSKELFKHLMQYKPNGNQQGWWHVSLDDFRKLLSIPESYRMTDIDNRILKQASQEFLPYSLTNPKGKNIFNTFEVEKVKQGVKVTHLKFKFTNYDKNELARLEFFKWHNSK